MKKMLMLLCFAVASLSAYNLNIVNATSDKLDINELRIHWNDTATTYTIKQLTDLDLGKASANELAKAYQFLLNGPDGQTKLLKFSTKDGKTVIEKIDKLVMPAQYFYSIPINDPNDKDTKNLLEILGNPGWFPMFKSATVNAKGQSSKSLDFDAVTKDFLVFVKDSGNSGLFEFKDVGTGVEDGAGTHALSLLNATDKPVKVTVTSVSFEKNPGEVVIAPKTIAKLRYKDPTGKETQDLGDGESVTIKKEDSPVNIQVVAEGNTYSLNKGGKYDLNKGRIFGFEPGGFVQYKYQQLS